MKPIDYILTVAGFLPAMVVGYMLGWCRGFYVRKGAPRSPVLDPKLPPT